ncbi:unnamed protein product, partial [Closterium sp. NIES-54]
THETNSPAVLSPRKHHLQAARQQNENGQPTEGKPKGWQRQKQGGGEGMGVVLMHLGVMMAGAAGVAVAFRVLPGHTAPTLLSAALWAAATASLACCKEAEATRVFSVPLCPWLPSASILVNTVLLASLDTSAFIRFIIWSTIVTIGYVLMVLLCRERKEEFGGIKGEHGVRLPTSPLAESNAAEAAHVDGYVDGSDGTGDVELTPLITHAQT